MSRTLVVLMIVAVLGLSAAAQPAREREQERIAADLREYHALLASYRQGNDIAVVHLLAWDAKRLQDVLAHADAALDRVRPWERGRYAAAALLHTEAALALLARKDASGVSFHLDTASRLFVRGGPDLRSVASRWYVAVVRVLRDRTWVKHAEQLLELGRRRLPADPPVLCESGTLAEWLATDPTLGPSAARQLRINAAGPGRPLSRGAFTDLERRRAFDLRRAAGWLTDALEHGSSDAMCRLHLGRVWSLQGEYERSDPLLLELRDHGDDAVAYLASAFLGASAERRDQLDQAASHYRSAIARFPRGHAAYFGLSGVLQKSGRISEARGVLDDVVDAEENNRREPWWWYFVEPERFADRRLQEFRNEVVR